MSSIKREAARRSGGLWAPSSEEYKTFLLEAETNRIEELIADSFTPEEPHDFDTERSDWIKDVIPFYGAILHRDEAFFLIPEIVQFFGTNDEIAEHIINSRYMGRSIRFLTESDGLKHGFDIILRRLQECDYLFQREKRSFPASWAHREAAT